MIDKSIDDEHVYELVSKNISWSEFKDHIDRILEGKGVSCDEQLSAIEIIDPCIDEIGADGFSSGEIQVILSDKGIDILSI